MAIAKHWWTLNNSLLDGVGTMNGTLRYGGYTSSGVHGACLDKNSSATFDNIADVFTGPDCIFTITGWVEIIGIAADSYIFYTDDGLSHECVSLRLDGFGNLIFTVWDNVGPISYFVWNSATHGLFNPGFHLFEITYNIQSEFVTQRVSLSIDKVLIQYDTYAAGYVTAIKAPAYLSIGNYRTSAAHGVEPFRVADLRIYSGVITTLDQIYIDNFLNPSAVYISRVFNLITGHTTAISGQIVGVEGINFLETATPLILYAETKEGHLVRDITASIVAGSMTNLELHFTIPETLIPEMYYIYVTTDYGISNKILFQIIDLDQQANETPYSIQYDDKHKEEALSRLVEGYKDADNIKNIIGINADRIQDLENVCKQLALRLTLHSPYSIGAILDGIGELVGLPRFSSIDADYIKLLQGKILANQSKGTTEDIIAVFKALSGATFINVVDEYPAQIRIESNAVPVNGYVPILKSALSAGVSLDIVVYEDLNGNFGFGTLDLNIPNDPTILNFGTLSDPDRGGVFAEIIY